MASSSLAKKEDPDLRVHGPGLTEFDSAAQHGSMAARQYGLGSWAAQLGCPTTYVLVDWLSGFPVKVIGKVLQFVLVRNLL